MFDSRPVHSPGRERTGYVPPGWPARVLPPGASDWEASAASFLMDCCPSDFRGYPVLRRYPVVLARFAAEFVGAQVRASQEAVGELRLSLEDQVSAEVVQAAVDLCQEQAAHLQRLSREVSLVEESLRGRVFVPRLT